MDGTPSPRTGAASCGSAAFPAAPFEVLDRVRQIDALAGDAGVGERLVEQRAGRSDERLTLPVLLIARLLADEQDLGVARALPEDDLGGGFVEFAAATALRRHL